MQHPDSLEAFFRSITEMDTQRFSSFLTPHAPFRFRDVPAVGGRKAIGHAVQAFFCTMKKSDHRRLDAGADRDALSCQGAAPYTRSDRSRLTVTFVNVFAMVDTRIDQPLIHVDIKPLHCPAGR